MRALFLRALEQLQWQWEHANNREATDGMVCAVRKHGGDPNLLIVYAWGNGARDLYNVLQANGMTEDSPGARTFPAKPDQN